ncbi:MAG: hypothetical protein WA947_06675 [Phormidesmis sp.]
MSLFLLTCWSAKANAQELRYQAVWSSGSGSNVVTEPLNKADFIQRGQQLTSQGLRLVDVETERINGERIYAGVWVSGSGNNIFDGPLTRTQFRSRREELRSQGLRLVDFEVFRANDGQERFVGVWRSGSGEEKLSLPRNTEAFLTLGETLTSEGLRLVDVEVERTQGELQYRGLWREGSGSNLFTTPQSPSKFRTTRDQMIADGLELIDVERVGPTGNHKFVGVWASGNGESGLSVPRNFENFVTLGEQQTAKGKRTEDFEIFLADAASTPTEEENPDTTALDTDEPDTGNSDNDNPTTVDVDNLPAWLEISNSSKIIVDFGTVLEERPRITLPIGTLPLEAFNVDGTVSIPTDFCGLRISGAESFNWQTPTGVEMTDAPYNKIDDVQAELGQEYYSPNGLGLSFTGAIGQCTEDNQPWQFNFPLTQNSGDIPIPTNLKLVIEVIPGGPVLPGGSRVKFLYAN